MEERYFIEPDTKFIEELIDLGGDSLKKCFQCGTCTVSCSLSPADSPFPRKELIWAQWGLKDRLLKDPDIWLCHNCNDCSINCPRGAKPGEVMAATRHYSIMHFSAPNFMAKAFSQLRYLPILLAIPVILLFGFLWVTGTWAFPAGEIIYHKIVPTNWVFLGATVAIIPWFGLAIGLWRFWKNISQFEVRPAPTGGSSAATTSLVARTRKLVTSVISALGEIMLHSNFKKCVANRTRYWAHLGLVSGAILYFISMTGSIVYTFTGREWPIPLWDPVVVFGIVGTLLIFAGCILIIFRRLSKGEETGKASYFDWFFIWLVFVTTAGSIAMMLTRIAGMVPWAYSLFLLHLVLSFTLVAYFPYSKFAHLIYRIVAIIYAKQIGRVAE